MAKRTKAILIIASVVVVAFLGLSGYLLSSFKVITLPTGSMANTIVPGESVLCLLNGSEVKRGEIVLFKLPSDPKVIFLKRIVGLPGDRIQVHGVKVFVNDEELPEARTYIEMTNRNGAQPELPPPGGSEGNGPYRVYYTKREAGDDQSLDMMAGMKYGAIEEFQIPPGQYFVLGDCRDNSLDSRYWGTVPIENIIGKALMIIASNDPQRQSKLYQRLR